MCETGLKRHKRYQAGVSGEKVCGAVEAFMQSLEVSSYECIENSKVYFDTVSLFHRPSENRHQFIYRKISSGTVCRNFVLVKYVSASQDKEISVQVFIRIRISNQMKPLAQKCVKGFINEHLETFLKNIGVEEYE